MRNRGVHGYHLSSVSLQWRFLEHAALVQTLPSGLAKVFIVSARTVLRNGVTASKTSNP